MKYETIGGAIHDTNYHALTIRELKIGDKFRLKSSKHIYAVRGEKCEWSANGTSVRKCLNLDTLSIEYKKCNTQVTRIT